MKTKKIDITDYTQKYINARKKRISFELILDGIRRKYVLKSLNEYNHHHILEIGCGMDPLFLYCTDYKTYTIVEPSVALVKNAKKFARNKHNITIIHGFMEEVYSKLIETRHGFDFIILSSILHEVPDPNKLLQAVYQICGMETVVHINVPNAYSFHRILAYEMGLISNIFEKSETDIKFQRHTNFDKQLLFKILEENGFQIITYGNYLVKPFSNEQMEKILEQKILSKDVIDGLERMVKYLPDMGCEIFVNAKIKVKQK
ncbi:MAG: methyltransferase domain-containing protein [Candidatus Bathyarchaeia archaeon]